MGGGQLVPPQPVWIAEASGSKEEECLCVSLILKSHKTADGCFVMISV